MSADALLANWSRPPRARSIADDVATGLPLPLLAGAVAWRLQGPALALLIVALGAVALTVIALRRARRFDRGWLIRQLDAQRADMDDSADLLFAEEAGLGPLQRLQRVRLEQRIAEGVAPDLRPAWSVRRIALAWGMALLAIGAVLWLPHDRTGSPALAPSAENLPVLPGVPRLIGQRLHIVPPAYTGLPPRDEPGLDIKAPQGSRLVWTLRFAPQPAAAALVFHNGSRLALSRDGDSWTAIRTLDRSLLYRVIPAGAPAIPAPPLHRLDAIADAPPQIRVLVPDRSLNLIRKGQRTWPLQFEATDDYGVAAAAQLRITTAQGEGENIAFRERMMPIGGSGPATRRRFSPVPDLAALGFTGPGDLVVQLIVHDDRAPVPQIVRSPSLILRWPPDLGQESSGLEGMVRKTLPAYFRSQRQIIIDAEALLKEKRALTADHFLARSDAIGVDQRILRMRYGQFLGEESEGGAKPPPTSDAPQPTSDDHDHESAPDAPKSAFGAAEDVLGEYGHTHDQPEAATLLDPETRATLKQALDQMWQSEAQLRQGHPQQALPFAYKALGFIKQVQQATRIFLARVGPELPLIDESRRMIGKRDGLASRERALAPRKGGDAAPLDLWRTLEGGPTDLPLDAFDRWLGANEARVADPLALVGVLDAVRRDPACAACRRTLRDALWPLLSRPPAAVARRAQSEAGHRYLDALRR